MTTILKQGIDPGVLKAADDKFRADCDAVLDLILNSAFFVAQAVAKAHMFANKPGSLTHMSSQMGQVGGPNRMLSCASKWALEGFNKPPPLDFAPKDIRTNTIAPTFIETPMTEVTRADPDAIGRFMAHTPLRRPGRPEELVGPVLFLASEASSYMTGALLPVDGGYLAA